MRLSYGVLRPDEDASKLASKIVKVLIESGLTYKQTSDALDVAQEMLLVTTKPTCKQTPQQGG